MIVLWTLNLLSSSFILVFRCTAIKSFNRGCGITRLVEPHRIRGTTLRTWQTGWKTGNLPIYYCSNKITCRLTSFSIHRKSICAPEVELPAIFLVKHFIYKKCTPRYHRLSNSRHFYLYMKTCELYRTMKII